MSTYLLINTGIILIPLILSFESKLSFYRRLPHVLLSIIFVGTIFVSWDIHAAHEGHWSFNKNHTGSISFFGLPLEEILFFITVPYAMLFLYETFNLYFGKTLSFKIQSLKIRGIISAVLLFAAVIYFDQSYTFLALLTLGVFFLISVFYNELTGSGLYWIFILFSFIPFFIVNYILTSLPVVSYNPDAIWGYRFFTIPLEDFLYSFALISFYLLVYKSSLRIFGSLKKA